MRRSSIGIAIVTMLAIARAATAATPDAAEPDLPRLEDAIVSAASANASDLAKIFEK